MEINKRKNKERKEGRNERKKERKKARKKESKKARKQASRYAVDIHQTWAKGYSKTGYKPSYHSWTRQTRRRKRVLSASKRVRDALTATVVCPVRTLSYTTIKYMQSI